MGRHVEKECWVCNILTKVITNVQHFLPTCFLKASHHDPVFHCQWKWSPWNVVGWLEYWRNTSSFRDTSRHPNRRLKHTEVRRWRFTAIRTVRSKFEIRKSMHSSHSLSVTYTQLMSWVWNLLLHISVQAYINSFMILESNWTRSRAHHDEENEF